MVLKDRESLQLYATTHVMYTVSSVHSCATINNLFEQLSDLKGLVNSLENIAKANPLIFLPTLTGAIEVWQLVNSRSAFRNLFYLYEHDNAVHSISINSNKTRIISGSSDKL